LWEAGLPKGVLNFIAHTREDAPRLTETMIAHSAVKRITFTGSDVVGSKVRERIRRSQRSAFNLSRSLSWREST
jgi:benzaldehyde dehydrogenase (NAD)